MRNTLNRYLRSVTPTADMRFRANSSLSAAGRAGLSLSMLFCDEELEKTLRIRAAQK